VLRQVASGALCGRAVVSLFAIGVPAPGASDAERTECKTIFLLMDADTV